MAEVASQNLSPNPSDQVPLDTIPVSPNGPMTDTTNGATSNEKIVTVFQDAENFNVKHQLQHVWTLWFTKPPTGKQDWSELLKEVISFQSVEEFWGIYVSFVQLMGAFSDGHVLTSLVAEQHYPSIRARPEIRLPPLQVRCAPRVGRFTEQVWRPLALHFQEHQGQRRSMAQHHAWRYR